MDSRLRGKQILIVDDGHLLVGEVRQVLESMGAMIVGPLAAVDEALALIVVLEVDAAVLDIELHEEDAFAIADELLRKEIPIVFASGMERHEIPKRFDGYHLLAKPAEIRLIIESLFGPPH